MAKKLFTSESVTEGHPDKICDQISDAVLDAILEKDPMARVACETTVTTGLIHVMGEITTNCYVDIPRVARDVVRDIGYDRAKFGFDCDTCAVITSIDEQSPDIALGVDKCLEVKEGVQDDGLDNGAGDQGMMFGYACDETQEYMPLPISLAQKLARRLTQIRKEGLVDYLRPDGKTQVTVEYDQEDRPLRIDAVVVSTQHGPEVELAEYNFDKLNAEEGHPSRDWSDTFYFDAGSRVMLRSQTSPMQVRAMETMELPIRIIAPGRVYRKDEVDATHSPMFHQVEGMVIDKNVTMADLKGVLDKLAVAMFGPEAKTRLRPSYFPFTEPSAELDLWFPDKKGGAGWLEWGGCGMVNPNVLKSAGIDPEEYTGFAFGVGMERTLLLRSDINDMHDLVEGDVRFSEQFVMGE